MGLTKILRDTLIIIAITCSMLAIIELTLRTLYPDKIDTKVQLSPLAYEHNDTHLISLKPNIEKEFKFNGDNGGGTINWKTNSFGFRGEEIGRKTGLRVIVYGDSNIQARFTQTRNTYTTVLQGLLKAKYKNAEVINAGLVGAGPDQSLIRLSKHIDKVTPDIVIFHVFADNDYGDIIRNRLFKITVDKQLVRTKYQITKDQEITSRESTFHNWFNSMLLVRAIVKLTSKEVDIEGLNEIEKIAKTISNIEEQSEIEYEVYRHNRPRQISHFADHYDIDIATDPESESAQIKISLMEKILLEAEKITNSNQITFLVVIQPSVYDLTQGVTSFGYQDLAGFESYRQDNLTKPLRNICELHKLNCVHLWDIFLLNEPGSLYRNNDNHWNDKGQRKSAEATATMIFKLLD